jgi:hypothetical protein
MLKMKCCECNIWVFIKLFFRRQLDSNPRHLNDEACALLLGFFKDCDSDKQNKIITNKVKIGKFYKNTITQNFINVTKFHSLKLCFCTVSFNFITSHFRFECFCKQAWSILKNHHRKPIRIDSKSIQFRLESIRCKIWKSWNVTYFFDSIWIFILACFQKNRCYFDIIKIEPIHIENTWKLWNNCFVTDFILFIMFQVHP